LCAAAIIIIIIIIERHNSISRKTSRLIFSCCQTERQNLVWWCACAYTLYWIFTCKKKFYKHM